MRFLHQTVSARPACYQTQISCRGIRSKTHREAAIEFPGSRRKHGRHLPSIRIAELCISTVPLDRGLGLWVSRTEQAIPVPGLQSKLVIGLWCEYLVLLLVSAICHRSLLSCSELPHALSVMRTVPFTLTGCLVRRRARRLEYLVTAS